MGFIFRKHNVTPARVLVLGIPRNRVFRVSAPVCEYECEYDRVFFCCVHSTVAISMRVGRSYIRKMRVFVELSVEKISPSLKHSHETKQILDFT